MKKRYEFRSEYHVTLLTDISIKDGVVHGMKVGRLVGSMQNEYRFEACAPVEFYGVGDFTLTEFTGKLY